VHCYLLLHTLPHQSCLFVARSLDAVPSAATEKFVKMAEDVAASRGAIPALAAAIAVISGNDKPRSLLTATPVSRSCTLCSAVLQYTAF